jgi:hypothetical protein
MDPVPNNLEACEDCRSLVAHHLGFMPAWGELRHGPVPADADLPFLSKHDVLWQAGTYGLERQMADHDQSGRIAPKIASTFLTVLPTGRSDAIAMYRTYGLTRTPFQAEQLAPPRTQNLAQ